MLFFETQCRDFYTKTTLHTATTLPPVTIICFETGNFWVCNFRPVGTFVRIHTHQPKMMI